MRPHDERIHALTGQRFGERYFNELLLNESLLLDSEPPIRAVLAVSELGGDGLPCCTASRRPTYRDGEWVGSPTRWQRSRGSRADTGGISPWPLVGSIFAGPSGHKPWRGAWLGGQGFPDPGIDAKERVVAPPVSSYLGEPAAFGITLPP